MTELESLSVLAKREPLAVDDEALRRGVRDVTRHSGSLDDAIAQVAKVTGAPRERVAWAARR